MAGKAQGQEEWSDDESPLLENSGAQHTPGSGATQTIAVNNQCDGDEASIMDEMVTIATKAKAAKRLQQEKERNSTGFGVGLKKGFFNQSKTTKAKTARGKTERLEMSESSAMKKKEGALRIVSQASSNQLSNRSFKSEETSPFVFPEVQEALKSMNQLNPNDWMNEEFFGKMAKNPKLLQALQNPRFTQAMSELQQNPQAAILKYQRDPDVSLMLHDFMEFLGNHFEEMRKQQEKQQKKTQPPPVPTPSRPPAIVDLDETRRHAIANMKRSPEEEEQVQRILQNPELLAALSDAKLMEELRKCQQDPAVFQRLKVDPVLGPKLRLLIDAKMVTFA